MQLANWLIPQYILRLQVGGHAVIKKKKKKKKKQKKWKDKKLNQDPIV
jgi:hypothetical protein